MENNNNLCVGLMTLALASGFRGYEKDGKHWLMTTYEGKTFLTELDFSKSDIFNVSASKILEIIDSRLGIKHVESDNLEVRYKALIDAFGDTNNKFWDIAKKNQ